MPLPSTSSPKRWMRCTTSGSVSLPGDQLQQLHVAHGVEEVRHEEVLAEVRRRGPRSMPAMERPEVLELTMASWLRVLLHLGEQGLLDGHVLLHHLDDPVALGDAGQVVLEVAHLDGGEHLLGDDGAGAAACAGWPGRPSANLLRKALEAVSSPGAALGGTMSSSSARTPELARCAAMPLPITPAPSTATLRIRVVIEKGSLIGMRGLHKCRRLTRKSI